MVDLEIHIAADGTVTFTELPEDLVHVVSSLDPGHPVACAVNALPNEPSADTQDASTPSNRKER